MGFQLLESFYHISEFDKHHLIKNNLLEAINQAEASPLQTDNIKTNAGSDISRTDWKISEDGSRRWVNIFSEFLLNHLDQVYGSMGYSNYSIKQIWFQQYNHIDSKHAWHSHGCCFTNVYYLEMPENSPKTEYIVPYGQYGKDKIVKQFDVKEGTLLVFPSYVIHRAPPMTNTDRKTIISFNVDVSTDSNVYV